MPLISKRALVEGMVGGGVGFYRILMSLGVCPSFGGGRTCLASRNCNLDTRWVPGSGLVYICSCMDHLCARGVATDRVKCPVPR